MDNNSQNTNSYGAISLESILSEYKSNAFISGERKTPKEQLDIEAERILASVLRGEDIVADVSSFEEPEAPAEEPAPQEMPVKEEPAEPVIQPPQEKTPEPKFWEQPAAELSDFEKEFFGAGLLVQEMEDWPKPPVYEPAPVAEEPEIPAEEEAPEIPAEMPEPPICEEPAEPEKPIEESEPQEEIPAAEETAQETVYEKPKPVKKKKEIKRFLAARISAEKHRIQKRRAKKALEAEEAVEEPELEPAEAARIYGATLNSLFTRALIGTGLCIIQIYLTLAGCFGLPLPSIFSQNGAALASVMLLFLLLTMLTGLDVIIVGLKDVLKLRPGAESLICYSCFVSIIDAVVKITSGGGTGVPFCGVSAVSLVAAVWALRYYRSAMRTSLITASVSAAPYVVNVRENMIDNGPVAVKRIGGTSGFTILSEQPDFGETVNVISVPLFIVASFVFALIASIGKSGIGTFFHCFSAMSAVSAQFSLLFVFGFPFYITSKKLMRSGAAVAGWAGAAEISKASGVVVRDDDLFPMGTLSMNGIKMFNGANTTKIVSYTGSIIIASGSGLSGIFHDLMRQQGSPMLNVEGLSCYESGGVGADIGIDKILVGSSGFMNLMGIRLPQELNVKNAVFTAVNNELAGIFAVNYTPASSVQNALISLLRTKISTILAVRDFNISPHMLTQKFKISGDKLEYMTVEERYQLSAHFDGEDENLAVLCREGLNPFAEAVAGGKRLVRVCRLCTLISQIGALLGLLLMFYLCYSGAFTAASAANTLLYMLMWLIPVLLIGNSSGMY